MGCHFLLHQLGLPPPYLKWQLLNTLPSPFSAWFFSDNIYHLLKHSMGFPSGASSKEPACQCRRLEFNPLVRKICWRRVWQPLQYSCLENPMDRGAWQATVRRVAKSRAWLRQLSMNTHAHVQFCPKTPNYLSKWVHYFAFPPAMSESSRCSKFCQDLILSVFWILVILNGI